MQLYCLEAVENEYVDYDERLAAVIAADSAAEAREIMSSGVSRFDKCERWIDPARSSCRCIGNAAPQLARGEVMISHRC